MDKTITIGYTEATRNWQIIFKTKEGTDYCRETRPSHLRETEVIEWTKRMLVAHDLGSARIERW